MGMVKIIEKTKKGVIMNTTYPKDVVTEFKRIKEAIPGLTYGDIAQLVLAQILENQLNDIDHQICMGIRHGLFGANAQSDETILDIVRT